MRTRGDPTLFGKFRGFQTLPRVGEELQIGTLGRLRRHHDRPSTIVFPTAFLTAEGQILDSSLLPGVPETVEIRMTSD